MHTTPNPWRIFVTTLAAASFVLPTVAAITEHEAGES